MKSSSKQIIKKYFISCIILGSICILLWVVYYLYTNDPIGTILFLLVDLFIIRISTIAIAKKTLLTVLCNNLNAIEFQNIINDKHFSPPLIYRTIAAIENGNYQIVVNITTKQFNDKKSNLQNKLYYLCLLARVYFELRDFEKLSFVLKKYTELKEFHHSRRYFNVQNSIWDYYYYFLEGDFETCKLICQKRNLQIKPKTWGYKIQKLQNDFFYAIACYENKNVAEATECFETIISFTPNMHLSKISKKYIDAINTGSKIEIFAEVVPENSYQLYDSRTTKKRRRYRIISTILLIFVCSAMIASSVIDCILKKRPTTYESDYAPATTEFENKLNNAIAKNYDNANFITYFNVTDGTQHIDAFCFVDHGNGLDLASVVTYDGGESLDLIILIENVQIPNSYSVKSAVSDNQIDFSIFDAQISTSNSKEPIEFTLNNKNYWIVIESIRPLN